MEYHALVANFWATGTFWVTVAVVIFFLAVGGKLWGIIGGILDKRAIEVREALAEAAKLKAEAEAMLADATVRQAQAIKDAKQILDMAHDEAARTSAELAAEAHATAERRKNLALQRIQAAEKSAVNEVRIAAIDIATAAATQILSGGLDPEMESAMMGQAIAGIPAALRQTV